jgi:hypothetical protein
MVLKKMLLAGLAALLLSACPGPVVLPQSGEQNIAPDGGQSASALPDQMPTPPAVPMTYALAIRCGTIAQFLTNPRWAPQLREGRTQAYVTMIDSAPNYLAAAKAIAFEQVGDGDANPAAEMEGGELAIMVGLRIELNLAQVDNLLNEYRLNCFDNPALKARANR